MPGGIITDTVQDIGYNVWLAGSALSIVAGVLTVRNLAVESYQTLLKSSSRSIERWQALISLYTVFLILIVITCVGALRIVLDKGWVEQITSALVVGVGFGLQGLILDTVWGYIRRTNEFVMDSDATLEVVFNGKLVKGRITNMYISSFTFLADDEEYVIGWSSLREFKKCKCASTKTPAILHPHNHNGKHQ